MITPSKLFDHILDCHYPLQKINQNKDYVVIKKYLNIIHPFIITKGNMK